MRSFILSFGVWCLVVVSSEGIMINEVMYHPSGANESSYEWVELYNDYVVPLYMGGWSLAGAIDYTFPADTIMAGNSYLVVCADKAAMRERYFISDDKLMGPFEGRLDNAEEEIVLRDRFRASMAHVRYRDREPWPAGADGTGHSLALLSPDLENDESESWAVSPQPFGSPGEPNGFESETTVRTIVLIQAGDEWNYFKGTEAPSEPTLAWMDPDFDDETWLKGATGIGYDDGDDATVLDDMRDNYLSVFCRKAFEVDDIASIEAVTFTMTYDDGFVAFLNGEELDRRNMGERGEVFPYDRAATGGVGSLPETVEIPVSKTRLQEGRNVLAIQVHNSTLGSTDLSMIPSLVGRSVETSGGIRPIPVVINEFLANPRGEAEDIFVELYNNGGSEVDVSLTYLSDDPADLTKYRIPVGTVLSAWGTQSFAGTEMGFQLSAGSGAIYFTSSDLERIIDAYAYGATMPNISRGRYPDGEEVWYNMLEPTSGEPNKLSIDTSIVINEIMYHPYDNDRDDEYIELYNRGGEEVDISGWGFSKGVDFTFPPGTVIAPGQYLVVAKKWSAIVKKYRISNVIGDFGGSLDNQGESVELVDTLWNVVDRVRYFDGGRWPIWAAGWRSSLELIDPRQDNSAPCAWGPSNDRDAAKWTYVEYNGEFSGGESEFHFFLMHRGECLIDDISVKRDDQEHLTNGSFESGTSDWKIEGNHIQSTIHTEDAHGGSQCLKIVATGRGDTGANRIECETSPSLRAGQPYTVSFWVKWQRGINLIYTRTHNQGMPKASRFPMGGRPGTPGERNSVYSANQGPVVWNVTQTPVVPRPSDPVRVTARVSDSDGIASVLLYFKGDYDYSYDSVPMYDDGLHEDYAPGDGLYAGQIPARGSTDLMSFYIVATDTLSESLRYPAKEDTYCLYQIDNSSPSTKFPIYRILLKREVDQQLRNRNRLSNELADCTFVLNDNEIFYNCGLRTRGSGWTRGNHPSNHYRIRFPIDQPLRGVQREINLDWRTDDNRQKDRLVHHFLRQLGGVPTSYQRYVHVRFKDGFKALAEEPQQVDGTYVRFYWPDDASGTLFKVDDHFEWTDYWSHTHWDAYLTWQGDKETLEWDEPSEKEKYRWNWKLRTNEKQDDYTDFLKFVRLMDPDITSDIDFDRSAEEVMDVEEWLKVLCVRFLVDDWDTLGYDRGKNAYVYRPYRPGNGTPEDPPRYGRWVLLPWDSDLTFANSSAPIVAAKFPSIERMLTRPKYQRLYYSYYMKMINGAFTREHVDTVVDAIYKAFSGEPGSPNSPASIKSFVSSRASVIRSRIPQPKFAITTNSGEDFEVEEPRVTLEGTAPVTIRTMTRSVNGELEKPFGPAWNDATSWRATFSVSPGSNFFQIRGLDEDANEVDMCSITVTLPLSPTEDSDEDGLFDKEEDEVYHTDYRNPDTDGDGLIDGDEVHLYLTQPTNADSDGDALPDGWEVDNGLDPNASEGDDGGAADLDGDGLANLKEFEFGTNPRSADTDGDGMDDGDEVEAGTDPADPTSLFRVLHVTRNGEGAIATNWRSVPGREYAVYRGENLMNWELLQVVVADSETASFLDIDAVPDSAGFYRIEVLPLP